MNHLQRLGDLYAVAGSLASGTARIEIVIFGDAAGSGLDRTVRKLSGEIQPGDGSMLSELVAAARSLRWCLATEPFPAHHSRARSERVQEIAMLANRCKFTVGADTRGVLDGLMEIAARSVDEVTPPAGEFLVQFLEEIGRVDCIVVLASPRAAVGTQSWFDELGINVPVATVRQHAQLDVRDSAFYIGPPSLFGPTVTAAPRAQNITYMFGSWVQDRSLPRSKLAAFTEGSPPPRARLYQVGDEPNPVELSPQAEDTLIPQPLWRPSSSGRKPGADEVLACRVLLGGGLSIMLDRGGDLIRTLNPDRPPGERVDLRPVAALAPGAFLVLREGETGSEALYERAMILLGDRRDEIEESQDEWKSALLQRLLARGRNEVIHALRHAGLKAAGQAAAWTVRTVARPQRDDDFRRLLVWLGLAPLRYVENANLLRRHRSRAMAEVREELEHALAEADVSQLDQEGYLRIEQGTTGFAGITATRVLAISPHEEVVHKHAVRIPREDRSARWLE